MVFMKQSVENIIIVNIFNGLNEIIIRKELIIIINIFRSA
jgi:hypothetical protein